MPYIWTLPPACLDSAAFRQKLVNASKSLFHPLLPHGGACVPLNGPSHVTSEPRVEANMHGVDQTLYACRDSNLDGRRLGSGGGTAHALYAYYCHQRNQKPNRDASPFLLSHRSSSKTYDAFDGELSERDVRRFEAWLDDTKEGLRGDLTVLHAGGWAKRLPSYAVLGKASIPTASPASSQPDSALHPPESSSLLGIEQLRFCDRVRRALKTIQSENDTEDADFTIVVCGDVHLRVPFDERSSDEDSLTRNSHRSTTCSSGGDLLLEESLRHALDAFHDSQRFPDLLCLGLEHAEGLNASSSASLPSSLFSFKGSERLSKHGVFVQTASQDAVALLQKPTQSMLQTWALQQPGGAAALAPHRFFLDVGLWVLSRRAVKFLCKASLRPTGSPPRSYTWQETNLFTDLLPTESFLPPAAMEQRNEVLSVAIAALPRGSQFDHIGSSAELLEWPGAPNQLASVFVSPSSPGTPDGIPAIRSRNRKIISTSAHVEVPSSITTAQNIFCDRCVFDRASFASLCTHHHIFTGLPYHPRWGSFTLPPCTCIDVVPVRIKEKGKREGFYLVLRPYHLHDTFSGFLSLSLTATKQREMVSSPSGDGSAGEPTFLHGRRCCDWLQERQLNPSCLMPTSTRASLAPKVDISEAHLFPCFRLEAYEKDGAVGSTIQSSAVSLLVELASWMVLPPSDFGLSSFSAPTAPFTASASPFKGGEGMGERTPQRWYELREQWLRLPRLSTLGIQKFADVDSIIDTEEHLKALNALSDLRAWHEKGGSSALASSADPSCCKKDQLDRQNVEPFDLDGFIHHCAVSLVGFFVFYDYLAQCLVPRTVSKLLDPVLSRSSSDHSAALLHMLYKRLLLFMSCARWCSFIALIPPTPAVLRDVMMGGESLPCLSTRETLKEIGGTAKHALWCRQQGLVCLRLLLLQPYFTSEAYAQRCRALNSPAAGLSCTLSASTTAAANWVEVRAPVRVDFAGGWTDLPPYTFWQWSGGGSVLNMAIRLAPAASLAAPAPPIRVLVYHFNSAPAGKLCVRVKSVDQQLSCAFDSFEAMQQWIPKCRFSRHSPKEEFLRFIDTDCDEDFSCKHAFLSIPVLALVLLGFCPLPSEVSLHAWGAKDRSPSFASLQDALNACGGRSVSIDMKVSVPPGSGLGTSAALGAVVVRALSRWLSGVRGTRDVLGGSFEGERWEGDGVLLEQLIGTGGGWQDEFGALVPGLKLLRSPASLPLWGVETQTLPHAILFSRHAIQSCHLLYFTGLSRSGSTIVGDMVEGMCVLEPKKMIVLQKMKSLAESMAALIREMQAKPQNPREYDAYLAAFGQRIGESGALQREIDPSVSTPYTDWLMRLIKPHVYGAKLCGAGGGGFLYIVTRSPADSHRVRELLTPRAKSTMERESVECVPEKHGEGTSSVEELAFEIDSRAQFYDFEVATEGLLVSESFSAPDSAKER